MEELSLRKDILQDIENKSALQQAVYDNTLNVLSDLKDVLHAVAEELTGSLDGTAHGARIEYRDRGKFEAQVQIGADMLIFSMHTDVFLFNREHVIWQNSYVQKDRRNAYCGMISIYNFLSDSFRYNRDSDEGYLIGRIFVNRENQYFVEGKRQISLKHNNFGTRIIDKAALLDIVEIAVRYSLEFDLLVPPYDTVKIISVDQLNTKIEDSKIRTGKRLGYKFNSDDI